MAKETDKKADATATAEEATTATANVSMIYGAIAAIMDDTKAIGKTQKNTQQGFMFRGIDAVMNELHGIFAKHKVFIIPKVKDFVVSEKTTGRGTILYYTRATIDFHFTTIDGSEIVTTNVGEAMDSGDKGMNKAMSIALKYALMQMLLIPTAEEKDPDAQTPEETRPATIDDIINRYSPDTQIHNVLVSIKNAANKNALLDIWNDNPELQAEPVFKQVMTARKAQLFKTA